MNTMSSTLSFKLDNYAMKIVIAQGRSQTIGYMNVLSVVFKTLRNMFLSAHLLIMSHKRT